MMIYTIGCLLNFIIVSKIIENSANFGIFTISNIFFVDINLSIDKKEILYISQHAIAISPVTAGLIV